MLPSMAKLNPSLNASLFLPQTREVQTNEDCDLDSLGMKSLPGGDCTDYVQNPFLASNVSRVDRW